MEQWHWDHSRVGHAHFALIWKPRTECRSGWRLQVDAVESDVRSEALGESMRLDHEVGGGDGVHASRLRGGHRARDGRGDEIPAHLRLGMACPRREVSVLSPFTPN
jgi:hypothetical protein